jgi:hypothetical protein
MDRYKWYRLELPVKLERYLKLLQAAKPGYRGDESGFFLQQQDDKKHAYRFFWAVTVARTTFSDQGTTAIELIKSFCYCDFLLFEFRAQTWLRVLNPPRSSKELLNALEYVGGFGFVAEPVELLKGNDEFEFPLGTESRLVAVKAVCFLTTEGITARVGLRRIHTG